MAIHRWNFWDQYRREGECLVWTRARIGIGYGQVRFEGGDRDLAHRIAWTLTHGPIPEGMLVLHRCDNPPCGEPTHLFLGTQKDNLEDMARKGRGRKVRRNVDIRQTTG